MPEGGAGGGGEPSTVCANEIAEHEVYEPGCNCIEEGTITWQVDGRETSHLEFSTDPEIEDMLIVYDPETVIDHNEDEVLRACVWQEEAPLWLGIEGTCADIYIRTYLTVIQTYPAEFGTTLLSAHIGFRHRFTEPGTYTIKFKYSKTYTWKQYYYPGGVFTFAPDMNITVSDLTLILQVGPGCARTILDFYATVSDDAATNDAGFQDPLTWDSSGSTFHASDPHGLGDIGPHWTFYNTLDRFGIITYGPTLSIGYNVIADGTDGGLDYENITVVP